MTYERSSHNPGSTQEFAEAMAWRTELQGVAFDLGVPYDPREAHANPQHIQKLVSALGQPTAAVVEVVNSQPPTPKA